MHQLIAKLESKEAKIGVIGLGYVGLPLAVEFATAGIDVLGFEVDASKVESINAGTSYIPDVPQDVLAKAVADQHLSATIDFDRVSERDVVVVCVPTPLRKTRDPDLSYIIEAMNRVKDRLQKGQLIVLESTTYPGTTIEVVKPILEDAGLKVGTDVHLAFSPERIDPGNQSFSVHNTPKIVGGVSQLCTELTQATYATIVEHVVPVSSPTAAEMVKLLENTFRAVNIGLVNEVAIIADKLDLDVWEIINAASTKPFGFMPFYPGPGLGGHCIPIDPHYLSWKLRTLNYRTRFIELADDINGQMPEYVVNKTAEALNLDGKAVRGSKLLVLGVAYKRDVTDWRESPAVPVIRGLLSRGAQVDYQDSFVPEFSVADHHGGETMASLPLDYESMAHYDCVLIITDHGYFESDAILEHSKRVVDARNLTKMAGRASDKVIKL